MLEKYFGIAPSRARQLIEQAKGMKWSQRGVDRHAYLIGDYAVLSTQRLKLRNVTTRDDQLTYLDELIESLLDLSQRGVSVVPILGYCYDPDSADGTGFLLEKRARGQALFDDGILTKFQVWARKHPEDNYLPCDCSEEEARQYLLARTHEISCVPQKHFDQLVSDIRSVLQRDILIDCFGKSNFFYDTDAGFQLIDLDAHNDYRYGLTDKKPNLDQMTAICGLVPCLYATGTKLFSGHALDEQALLAFSSAQKSQLAQANSVIFEKCIAAFRQNNVAASVLDSVLRMVKIYGAE